MSSNTVRRKTVSLESHHLEAIRSILDSSSTAHTAFKWAIGSREGSSTSPRDRPTSESQVLRYLISLGLDRVRDIELDAGYALLARSRQDDDAAEEAAFLQLTAQTWVDED